MSREQQVIDSFSNIASGVLAQYSHNIEALTAIRGGRPSFDELMSELQLLEKDLTSKAVKIIEVYKKEVDAPIEGLTNAMKQIITNTINIYIKSI